MMFVFQVSVKAYHFKVKLHHMCFNACKSCSYSNARDYTCKKSYLSDCFESERMHFITYEK